MNHRQMKTALVPALLLTLAACATSPELGGSKDVGATGSAAGGESQGGNKQLEHCDKTMGTLAIEEDQAAPWYVYLRGNYGQLGSTVPLLRLLIQQSNCFVIVERGRGMANMMQERALSESGETRQNSNFGKGQIVAADYAMQPTINFAAKGTSGGAGGLGGLVPGLGLIAAAAASFKSNEASTTLLLIDNRSGVQLSASEGSAKNWDIGGIGGMLGGGFGAAGGGYSNTPEGKLLTAAFMDSYNQMVKGLRDYKAQHVEGGLGAGGTLGVDGGSTPASQKLGPDGAGDSAPAPTGAKKKKKKVAASDAGAGTN